ncbi:hypothetical protein [Agrococcus casei]|uniref:hypothetical protein n=1 Tax=Agrococcus casei TaxID=343512 RepID=UPI003F90BCDD
MNEPNLDMDQLIELSGKIGAILATPDDLSPAEQQERLRALNLPSQADLEELQVAYEQKWQDAQADLESRLSALRSRTDAIVKDIEDDDDEDEGSDGEDTAPPSSPAYGTD